VTWPESALDLCMKNTTVTNTITPGLAANGGQFSTGSGQVNTPARATLTCTYVAPVPTLGEWARLVLVLVVLVLVAGVWLARRQRPA
jgi:hypothetical protein